MIAALGPHIQAYQRNAPSVPHRQELLGHCGVHRERRCRVPWDVTAVALIVGTAVILRAVERKRRNRRAHGGSPQGRKPNRDRGMKEAENLLDRQYFCRTGDATSMLTDAEFERRFRMPRNTYETIRSAVLKQDPDFFEQRPDATGRLGASADQKMTAVLRMMCYGEVAEQLVEVLVMSESLIMECLPRYCDGIVESLGGMYVRETAAEELAKVEARFAELGFPGCVASVLFAYIVVRVSKEVGAVSIL
jgi:hypothetical protein